MRPDTALSRRRLGRRLSLVSVLVSFTLVRRRLKRPADVLATAG